MGNELKPETKMKITKRTKQATISRILDNPTFTNQSGVVQRVGESLLKLSLTDLLDLEMILQHKTTKHNLPLEERVIE